jgi:hypothetical protein
MNHSNKSSEIKVSSVNAFLISTNECTKSSSIYYCNYVASIILIGYLMHLAVFPLTLLRMKQLKKKFRNQYNLSLVWLCSLLLMSFIDILEYIVTGDANLFSYFIVLVQCFYFFACLMTIFIYVRYYEVNGAQHQNVFKLAVTFILFLIIIFTRIWTSSLESNKNSSEKLSPGLFTYTGKLAHFYVYYVIYVVFALCQVSFSKSIKYTLAYIQ